MPSPFPGMDPFLEHGSHWPDFQRHLVAALRDALGSAVPDRYRVRVADRRYTPEGGGEHVEEFLEVRGPDDRLVTLVEVVSPANRTTPAGRTAYLATRADALARGAGTAEVGLVLQGTPTLSYSRDALGEFDYAVSVTRPALPDRYEIYTTTLPKRLPKFKVPLLPDDRNSEVLDLQAAAARAYDLGNFAGRINYRADPGVPLAEDHRRWLDEVLREKGLRVEAAQPSADEVAVAAYHLWERAGRPDGQDQEHWYRAAEQLRPHAGRPGEPV
ncbi:MAG: DUF4058 family protein [Gemmataceae bacterium]|nr:DUF4058 family protein [Gemmataceae bacterium]